MAKTAKVAAKRRPARTRAPKDKKPAEFAIFDCVRLVEFGRVGVVLGIATYWKGENEYRVRLHQSGPEHQTDHWVAGSKLELA